MKRLGKNRFVCILLLLGATLPVTGQIYTTSSTKVYSVGTTGISNEITAPSFYSTSRYVSSGPGSSVSVPSISVQTSFSTSAAAITGGVTLAGDLGLDVEGKVIGPNKVAPPYVAPVGDIPWFILVLAALAFVMVKKARRLFSSPEPDKSN